MAKVAQVLDDVTKMKNVDLVVDLLNKSASSTPTGKYFNTSLTQAEQTAVLEALHLVLDDMINIDENHLTERQFQRLKYQLLYKEDDENLDVVTADTDGLDTVVVSTEEPNVDELDDLDDVGELDDESDVLEPAEDLDDMTMDDGADLDALDDVGELEDVEDEPLINISTDNPTDLDISIDDAGDLLVSTDDMDLTINNSDDFVGSDAVNEEIDNYIDDDANSDVLTSDEPLDTEAIPPAQDIEDVDEIDMEDEELSIQEQQALKQIKNNAQIVLSQIQNLNEACKTKKKTTKKPKIKAKVKAKKSNKSLEKQIDEHLFGFEGKKEKVIFEGLDVLIKKYDTLLENLLREEMDEDENLDMDMGEFDVNDSVDDVDDALEKSEDILTEPSDVVPEEEPSVVHITLPAGVTAGDISVKVIEESEGSPVIQIELPEGSNVDEVEATVGEPVSIDGQTEQDFVTEDIPEDTVDDTDIAAEDEDVIVVDDEVEDAELEEEDEEKLEEALKKINKKLLPIAENAKHNAFQANKNIVESAQQADTSYNITTLKQTHLYYMNEGKHVMDYRYPIADVIDGTVYAIPEAIVKMTEMFSNPSMVKKIGAPIVKIARARLTPYLEAMGKTVPWKNKKSNLVITEKGMLLTVCHKREAHDPSAILKRIREDIDGTKK